MMKIIYTTFILTTFLLTFLVVPNPVQAENDVVIDFEGLEAGTFVQSVSYGQGISGMPIDGSVTIFGHNNFFPGENAAMTFDAACPEGCTGFDNDLFAPEQGMVLIVSQDMDPGDPNDAQFEVSQEFFFQDLGAGIFTVESLTIGDVEDYEAGGLIEFYAGGWDGTLLATIPIPVTGNNVYASLPAGVSGVDYMRVSLKGSAAIDDISLTPEPEKEILYLSNTVVKHDGISNLYRLEIDEVNSQANLIPLPNGTVNYDHVDTIAVTPDGSRLYMIDEDTRNDPDSLPILSYYDFQTASVQEIGVVLVDGEKVLAIDQAAFSPEGRLYIASSTLNKLYTVNLENAEATEVGTLVNEATDTELNVNGADVAFSAYGELYLWINNAEEGAPAGLYLLELPGEDGQVKASHLGSGDHDHFLQGVAMRWNGKGDLVGMTRENELHIIDPTDATDVVPPLLFYLDGELFQTTWGDLSIGPFAQVRAANP